jgi:hypothetical protein
MTVDREAAGLKGYLTIREAAVLFKKSADTIERWTKDEEKPLPVFRFGLYRKHPVRASV